MRPPILLSFAIFIVATALPASAQTQQSPPVQTALLTVTAEMPEPARPQLKAITPPGTVDVEPDSAGIIATHAPRRLQTL